MVTAVLWLLAEQVRLQGEDVVEHSIDAPALDPVIGDDPRVLEVAAKRSAKGTVDARLSPDLSLFEELQAPVEGELS